MLNKRYKKALYLVIAIGIISLLYFKLKVNPDQIIICYYNGMVKYHKTYIFKENSLFIDTISDNFQVEKKNYVPIKPIRINLESKLVQIKVPIKLFFKSEKTIGCPGCIDQGGIRLKVRKFGIEKSFSIDSFNEGEFEDGLLLRIKNIIEG